MPTDPKPPAKRPCGTCPYRQDCPSGVWDPSEYAKLPLFDQDTWKQPTGLFLCHQGTGRICAGWAGCHDMSHTLAFRIAACMGGVDTHTVQALLDYSTDVRLFSSGTEAAAHGMREVTHPTRAASDAIHKIGRSRAIHAKRSHSGKPDHLDTHESSGHGG